MDLRKISVLTAAVLVYVSVYTPCNGKGISEPLSSSKLLESEMAGKAKSAPKSSEVKVAAKVSPKKTSTKKSKAAETDNTQTPAAPADKGTPPVEEVKTPPKSDTAQDPKDSQSVNTPTPTSNKETPAAVQENPSETVPAPVPPAPAPLPAPAPNGSAAPAVPVKPNGLITPSGPAPQQPLVLPAPVPGTPVPPAPVPPPSPQPYLAQQQAQVFNLNFDNADLTEVIDVLAKSLQINYMVDPRVKGTVTIHTAGRIAKPELFSILDHILKMNGVTILKVNDIYKIMPLNEAQTETNTPRMEGEAGETKITQGFVIQIIPLQFITPTQMSKILKPFLTPGANIYEVPVANVLIVTDMAGNVAKLLQMVKIFDIQLFENIRVEMFPIQNTSAEEVSTELESIFGAYGLLAKQGEGGVRFLPISRLNSILAVATNPKLLAQAGEWIRKLDQRAELGTDVHVYFVENVKADELASVLSQIYAPDKKSASASKGSTQTPKFPDTTRPLTTPQPQNPMGTPVADLTGQVRIIPDKASNALVIMATAEDFKIISQTIRKLDVVPRQVVIDVMIAEVTLGKGLQYGIGWSLQHSNVYVKELGGDLSNKTTFNDLALSSYSPLAGFGYRLIDSANNIRALLTLLADQSRLNILSCPNIIASNNQKASIKVGSEVPIVSSEYVPLATATTTTTDQSVTSRSIQYKDTGVLLTVTPHINSARLITMEVAQEVSEAQKTTTGVSSSPTFLQRKAETSLVVHDGQTALIGGLIQERKETSNTGIPWLKDIPLIGWLFGSRTSDISRTELIVLLTPRVIIERQELDQVTREMQERVKSLKSTIDARPH